MDRKRSEALFEAACRTIPGGVNSPVRSARAVGTSPLFIREASGCHIVDEDGNRYIDYVASWGPLITGHAHPAVVEAIRAAAGRGTSYGIPTRVEVEMAEKVAEMVPSIEMVRMVNSGTEATMSAIRLARGATGRKKVVKFDGCYHGHGDSLLVKSGSGLATLGIPGTPGVPEEIVLHTLSIPFNDPAALTEVFEKAGSDIAAVIVEPVPANMGVVLPKAGYLQAVRDLCTKHGALLIFDEVITGFRLSRGGAQQAFGITPDITTLGKIIGGGLPVGAYGGSRDLMNHMAPTGAVYQAGTLSGNPLAMSAGLAMLDLLSKEGVYEELNAKMDRLAGGLAQAAQAAGVPVTQNRIASMASGFFTSDPVFDFTSALKADTASYGLFFREMLARGVYFAPSQFEAFFVSTAHGEDDIDRTVEAAHKTLEIVRDQMHS